MICSIDKNTQCTHDFNSYIMCENYLPDCNCKASNILATAEHVCILDGRRCKKPSECLSRYSSDRDIVCDNQVEFLEKSTMFLDDEVAFETNVGIITKRKGSKIKILKSTNNNSLLFFRYNKDKYMCIDAEPYMLKLG